MQTRLTLWYTGVLALTLILFAVATYSYLARVAEQRTDAELADTASSFVNSFESELNDADQKEEAVADEVAQGFRFRDRQIIVFNASRQVIAISNVSGQGKSRVNWRTLPSSTEVAALINNMSDMSRSYSTFTFGGRLRAVAVPARHGGRMYPIVVAASLHDQEETLEQARRGFYFAVPLALLLASAGGYFLSRKSLEPIAAMGIQAARIGSENLHERLLVKNERDEIGRLSLIFNDLLSRLDTSFEQQRRFMADASHELRTPVAIVRGEAEVVLSRTERPYEDYRVSLQIILEQGRRLTRIVEDLFTIARADAGQHPLVVSAFYLEEVIADCVRSVRSLAQGHTISLTYEAPPGEMAYKGDEGLIRRMILNLLDNAIKFTPAGGSVLVSAAINPDVYEIRIKDTGCGIPPVSQTQIFERFYRVERKGDEGSGAGLGLSIGRWIAEKHRGSLILDKSDDSGSTFVALLPFPGQKQ